MTIHIWRRKKTLLNCSEIQNLQNQLLYFGSIGDKICWSEKKWPVLDCTLMGSSSKTGARFTKNCSVYLGFCCCQTGRSTCLWVSGSRSIIFKVWFYSRNLEHKFKLQVNVQVNLCQKLLFLHQLSQNMTKDCSLKCTWKLQA